MKKKKCKNCGKEFEPRNSLQPVCNYVCALAYNDKKQVEKRFKELGVDMPAQIQEQIQAARDGDLPESVKEKL